jgi:hypothetical protein
VKNSSSAGAVDRPETLRLGRIAMARKRRLKSKRSKRRVARKPKAAKTSSPDAAADSQSALAPSETSDPTQTKIFPRNLTARANFHVVGNPIVTRAEDAVANCYPGLELDIRNMDRRFFPGLVFNFVEQGPNNEIVQCGAKLAYVDEAEDPDLELNLEETQNRLYGVMKIPPKVAKALSAEFTDAFKASLASGDWFLDWIEQDGKRISTRRGKKYLTGLTVWRLIRGLEPKLVSIGLRQRKGRSETIPLHGWRRLYTDPRTGVISGAYQPGELMQGLCSPWQHDFRDCYCHYWASNRPDLVFGDLYPGESLLPGGDAVNPSLNVRLDWMRAGRSPELAVGAFAIIEENRPYQFDHYQINKEWQNLNIVLNGREIDSVHLAEPDDAANPYESANKLAEQLRDFLAPLELTFMFEYLYARFSLRNPDDKAVRNNSQLRDALTLAREYLLLIAISEMQHLRWVNEILWELSKAGKVDRYKYKPVIRLAETMPQGIGGPFQAEKPQKKADIPAYVENIKTYVKSKHKIRSHPTDEAATAKAIVDFESAAVEFGQAVDELENGSPAPRKAVEEFKKALSKIAQSGQDERPQEAFDKFKEAFDKFKEAHRRPPRDALDKLNEAFDKFKTAFDKFKKEHPNADPNEWKKRGSYSLTAAMQQAFINVERPDAIVDHAYARVAATLDQPGRYPPHLIGLARRILQDGMQHEARFNAIQAALKPFKEKQYLRNITLGSTKAANVKAVLDLRDKIIVALKAAYQAAARDEIEKSNLRIAAARKDMQDLLTKGEKLAGADIGIPFFERWPG